ncbi:MAG: hypothetical protein M3Z04_09010 [Chloroflexota bacterium]|nr:hypothetical protein [Chloroflexota bacterium]
MNNMPPNSASRRPEGAWQPPEDDDFKIVPQNTASSPVSSPVSAPPPPPVTYAPPRPATVIAPTPGKVAAPAKNNQRLILGIGAIAVLLAALAFFFVYQMLTGSSSGGGTSGGPVSLAAAATAVTDKQWDVALPGCANIAATVDPSQAKLASQVFMACGLHLLQIEPAEVSDALKYFKRADQLTPNDDTIKHQVDLAQRYVNADLTMRKDLGGAIGQFEWFPKQPEFAATPYADTATRLYLAYVDSGNGYLQIPACDLAKRRFEQAVAVKFVKDNSLARRRLDDAVKTCSATPKP